MDILPFIFMNLKINLKYIRIYYDTKITPSFMVGIHLGIFLSLVSDFSSWKKNFQEWLAQ